MSSVPLANLTDEDWSYISAFANHLQWILVENGVNDTDAFMAFGEVMRRHDQAVHPVVISIMGKTYVSLDGIPALAYNGKPLFFGLR